MKVCIQILLKLYTHISLLGKCILGCDNLTGTFWEGTLLYFNDENSLISMNNVGHYIYASSSDGKFLGPKMVSNILYLINFSNDLFLFR